MARIAETFRAVTAFAALTDEAAVPFEINYPFLVFRYGLQALNFVRDLARTKERLEDKLVTSSGNCGDALLDQSIKHVHTGPSAPRCPISRGLSISTAVSDLF
jgi:hypothetical protein